MPDIVLSTLNAKYIHASFGLRYLYANMGELRSQTVLREFTIREEPATIADAILHENPKIVGLGAYIWNATVLTEVIAALKVKRPDVIVVLGGPEVTYEWEQQPLTRKADFILGGEADVAFAHLCRKLLKGSRPLTKFSLASPPSLDELQLPYSDYNAEDIKNRLIYVEASRGCPFECEFCLSALDEKVRNFPLERFLDEMQRLLDRGVRHFKFVDRTFNLSPRISATILKFFLERFTEGLFLHFEMIPDRLPAALRPLIAQFPPGSLQFEIGVQTFDPDTEQNISRRQKHAKLEENFRFLRQETHVHVHSDLIAGLPGESLESFARGFDRLLALGPQEIQVGILKRLRGAPIARHTEAHHMRYNPSPPYDLIANAQLDEPTMEQLKRFARYWDLFVNSGHFKRSASCVWADADSAFWAFDAFSQWLFERFGRAFGIGLDAQAEALFVFLTQQRGLSEAQVGAIISRDYVQPGRRIPAVLESYAGSPQALRRDIPIRQARHLAGQDLPSVDTQGQSGQIAGQL